MSLSSSFKSISSIQACNYDSKYLRTLNPVSHVMSHLSSRINSLYLFGIIQILLLFYWSPYPMTIGVINVLIFSVIYISSLPLIRLFNTPGLFENFWVTWSVGGIGMLLGHRLDSFLSLGNTHLHHLNGEHLLVGFFQFLLSGMTIVMLLFCVPACLSLCNRCLSDYGILEKCILHGGSVIFMLLGMLLAVNKGLWLFSSSDETGISDHYFMLFLMVLCSASAYQVLSKIIDQVKRILNH